MSQRERQRRQGFAAARGYLEGEKAGSRGGGEPALLQHKHTPAVYLGRGRGGCYDIQMGTKCVFHLRYRRMRNIALACLVVIAESFRAEAVRVNQAGEKHAREEGKRERFVRVR